MVWNARAPIASTRPAAAADSTRVTVHEGHSVHGGQTWRRISASSSGSPINSGVSAWTEKRWGSMPQYNAAAGALPPVSEVSVAGPSEVGRESSGGGAA